MDTSDLLEQPDRMLESTLGWTNIPCRGGGSNNNPSRFMIRKLLRLDLRGFTI